MCGLFKNLWFSCRRYFKVPLPILLTASPLACRLRRQNFIARVLTIPPATQASPSCKPFADFVKKTLLEHLRTGAISLKGRISEVELTTSVADYWTETEQCYDINTREAIALNKVLLSFADVHKDARVDAEIDNKALYFSWCNQGGRSVTLNRAIKEFFFTTAKYKHSVVTIIYPHQ